MKSSLKISILGIALLWILIQCKSSLAQENIDSLIIVAYNHSLPDTQRVRLLISVYKTYNELENFTKGKPYLDHALKLALTSGYKLAVADVKAALGEYNLLADNYPEALRFHLQALKIYESEGIEDKASESQMYIGLVYYEVKNYHQAIENYNKATKKALRSNNLKLVSTYNYLKALALTQLEEYNTAHTILTDIINQSNSTRTLQRKIECYVGIGDIYIKRSLFDSAAIFYRTAYNYFDSTNNMSGLLYVGVKLAAAAYQQNQIDSALSLAYHSFLLSDSIDFLNQKIVASKVLADVYAKKNDFKQAYIFLNTFISLKDSIYSERNEKKLNNLILKSQQDETQDTKKEAEKQKILKNAFIIGFILATLLLIVSLVSIFQNRRKNKALNRSNLEVQQALNQLQATQEQLIRQEKLASLGQMVAGIAHEMQNPLNFVNNFAESSVQLSKDLVNADAEEKTHLLNDLIENMIRIKEHGNRASGIVRSMLLYSRNETFEKQKIDINSMLTDFIPLAYEGLHAENADFSCRIEKNFGQLPLVLCSPQDMSRVFLNLLTNAFYAVNDKKKKSGVYYLPVVTVTTFIIQGGIKITVHDNGNGIPDAIKEKVFEPFFTTKPSGKGTGLGLSLSYDIVKAHGGMLNVDSKVGIFTEFIITLPV